MKAIVAGIINTKTGEISDTISNASGKTKLYLKARDELNATHGKNAFMTFEFNGLGNISYVKKHMASNDPALTKELDVLSCKFQLESADKNIARIQKEIDFANEVSDDCGSRFSDAESAKRTFLQDLIEEEMNDINSNLNSAKLSKRHLKRRLDTLSTIK